jgi:membrane protease YdiL (CAAX protease family)
VGAAREDVSSTPAPAAAPRSGWRRVFLGPVRLRAGWRLALFVAVSTLLSAVVRVVVTAARIPIGDDWSPSAFVGLELLTFGIAVAATAIMARVDRLPFARFGLPWGQAFGVLFWEGALWGFVAVAVLVAGIAALGGYHVHGWAMPGGALAVNAALWLAAMVLVGLSEEASFRGYPLAALADGIGFWPAAAVLSIDFAATHYYFKPMENVADALSVGLIGLFLCFTLLRTGSLWFAIGFHFAFDFAAIPLCGAPNTGNHGRPVETRLLDATFTGPDWLTGGVRGIEASWLVFAVIAALFTLFHWRFQATRFPPPGHPPEAASEP